MCVNRFDDETKSAMLDLYTKVDENAAGVDPDADPSIAEEAKAEDAAATKADDELVPF